jgi:hypothetical protein
MLSFSEVHATFKKGHLAKLLAFASSIEKPQAVKVEK